MFSRISALVVIAAAASLVVARPGGQGNDWKPEGNDGWKGDSDRNTNTNTNIVNTPTVNECNYTGGAQCCNSLDYATPSEMQSLLSVVSVPVNADTLVGHGCSGLVSISATCNAQTVCCKDSYQGIGVSCNNVAL